MGINISNYLRVDLQDMIMVLVSTFLIVVIVKRNFWHYFREYLEKREAFIKSNLEESTQKLQESDELKQQYERQLVNIKTEANEIITTAKETANNEAKQIVAQARTDAEAIKTKASADIKYEQEKAKGEMKKQITDVAFMAAQQVVKKEMDEETQRKYVDDFISKAGDESWQA